MKWSPLALETASLAPNGGRSSVTAVSAGLYVPRRLLLLSKGEPLDNIRITHFFVGSQSVFASSAPVAAKFFDGKDADDLESQHGITLPAIGPGLTVSIGLENCGKEPAIVSSVLDGGYCEGEWKINSDDEEALREYIRSGAASLRRAAMLAATVPPSKVVQTKTDRHLLPFGQIPFQGKGENLVEATLGAADADFLPDRLILAVSTDTEPDGSSIELVSLDVVPPDGSCSFAIFSHSKPLSGRCFQPNTAGANAVLGSALNWNWVRAGSRIVMRVRNLEAKAKVIFPALFGEWRASS